MTSIPAARPPFRITGKHVLAGMVLFFGIVIGLDSYFMVLAYRSFPGQSAKDPYEAGLLYDRELDRQAQEAALGWSARVELTAGGAPRLTVTDAAGKALTGLAVTAEYTRPATERGEAIVVFREAAPGTYVGPALAARGGWDVNLTLRDSAGRRLHTERRLLWR